jgi:hypothetical protein
MGGGLTFHMRQFDIFDVNLWVDDGMALSVVN